MSVSVLASLWSGGLQALPSKLLGFGIVLAVTLGVVGLFSLPDRYAARQAHLREEADKD
ncbi:hypothetical protein [Kineococcus xinjiangensis]|uniref:hypothetical protein n=1 Tax=Kineococcus xinjiangensis TaxID=512762 RepID=UPI001304F6B1|nr:hypothetical protein [Kineococcus xinjiangensis]